MATKSEAGVSRVLVKLEGAVSKGDYYEAHQLYRTLYFRYLNQKKFDSLLDLLHRGAQLLLKHEQYASGTDLSILLVDVLVQSETKPNEEWIGKIADLFDKMSSTIPERDTYLTNAVKWSMNNNRRGHPLLHTKIAKIFWKEKKHTLAQKHFFRGNDGKAFATMLIYLQTQNGQECDVEMYIAQAVLQTLCLHNIDMAENTFKMYAQLHPALKNELPPYSLPLLSFIWLLINALRNDSVEQFRKLKTVYMEHLQCDSNYSEYLDTIGRVWFKETPSHSSRQTNNMFSNLLKNMVVDSSDDEDASGTTGKLAGEIPDLD